MFDVDELIHRCSVAVNDRDPRGAVRDVLAQTIDKPGDAAAALGTNDGGITVLVSSPEWKPVTY